MTNCNARMLCLYELLEYLTDAIGFGCVITVNIYSTPMKILNINACAGEGRSKCGCNLIIPVEDMALNCNRRAQTEIDKFVHRAREIFSRKET